uniref:Uncharacterized protein n=1 Tax=Oryza glumipatula TaxID=40148 RepID=A0A0D9YX22_9ORYZ
MSTQALTQGRRMQIHWLGEKEASEDSEDPNFGRSGRSEGSSITDHKRKRKHAWPLSPSQAFGRTPYRRGGVTVGRVNGARRMMIRQKRRLLMLSK